VIRPFFFENELDQLRRLLFQRLLKGVVRKVFCGSRLTQAASRRPVAAVKTLVDGHRPKAVIPSTFYCCGDKPAEQQHVAAHCRTYRVLTGDGFNVNEVRELKSVEHYFAEAPLSDFKNEISCGFNRKVGVTDLFAVDAHRILFDHPPAVGG